MPAPTDPNTFGLNELVVASMDGLLQAALPSARTLEFEETVVTGESTGDDQIAAIATIPTGVKGKIEKGGISLEAYAIITGHTFGETGTTPNQVGTFIADSSRYPYFQIFGRSLGDEGDDVHIHLKKVKLTSGLKGTFKYGEFLASEMEFTGIKVSGEAFELVSNETAEALTLPDSTPPAFTLSSVPADAATGVVVSSNIVLTFSNEIAAGAENAIILTTVAGVPKACARTINTARTIVTLNPSTDMAAATEYLIIVPGVTDIYAQTLADTVINFTTA